MRCVHLTTEVVDSVSGVHNEEQCWRNKFKSNRFIEKEDNQESEFWEWMRKNQELSPGPLHNY